MRTRNIPTEYEELGKQVIEAREVFEDLLGQYQTMTVQLSQTTYLSALAEVSPFSYQTLRRWVVVGTEGLPLAQ